MNSNMVPALPCLALALLLGGCAWSSASDDSEQLELGLSSQGTEVLVVPFSATILGCNGDVAVSGDLLITSQTVTTGTGETRVRFHNTFINVTGVDAAGTQYVVAAASTNGFEVTSGAGAIVSTNTSDLALVSQGSGDNLDVHLNIHTTINPDGTVTAEVFHITSECRG
jgi:hypothetical protein